MSATKKGAQHCNAEAPKPEYELTTQYGDFTTSEQKAQDEVDGKFTPKKVDALRLATVLDSLGLDGRAKRMFDCGDWLTFSVMQDKHKLTRANFCKGFAPCATGGAV